MLTEKELFVLLCSGDKTAENFFFVNVCGSFLSYLAWRFRLEVNELVGDFYIHLTENNRQRLRTWEGRSSLKSWGRHVAIRLCLKKIEKRKKDLDRFVDLENWEGEIASSDSIEDRIDALDLPIRRAAVLRALEQLKNEKERHVISRHCMQGIPLEAVAREMNIRRSYADILKHRAIERLREILKGWMKEYD